VYQQGIAKHGNIMDSDYGSEGYRFESYRGHDKRCQTPPKTSKSIDFAGFFVFGYIKNAQKQSKLW
jgi:hypothetical protein